MCYRRLTCESLEERQLLALTILEHENIGYFPTQEPLGFERYDIRREQWLEPIEIPELAHLSHAFRSADIDPDGIFLAVGSSIYRTDHDGTSAEHLFDAPGAVDQVFSDEDVFIVNYRQSGSVTGIDAKTSSYRKESNSLRNTFDTRQRSFASASLARHANFMVSVTGQQGHAHFVSYEHAGRFEEMRTIRFSGVDPERLGSKIWIFSSESKILGNLGALYSSDMEHLLNLGEDYVFIQDADFIGDELPVILHGNTVTAYAKTMVPTGSVSVGKSYEHILVNEHNAVLFMQDNAEPQGYATEIIRLSELAVAQPDEEITPASLQFVPDDLFFSSSGSFLAYSHVNQAVFEFDPTAQSWTNTIPLIGSPIDVIYAEQTNTIYTAYRSGNVYSLDLNVDEPREKLFVSLPRIVHRLGVTEEFLLVVAEHRIDGSVRMITFDQFGNALDETGINSSEVATEYVWHSELRRLYYYTDDFHPREITWREIATDGTVGTRMQSPNAIRNGFARPIRISPDGTRLFLGSGLIHDSEILERLPDTLTNPVQEIRWLGDRIYSLRTIADHAQIQVWDGMTLVQQNVTQLPGEANQLLTIGDDRLFAVSLPDTGIPQMTVFDAELNIIPRPSPVADAGRDVRADIGSAALLDGSASFDPDNSPEGLTYDWTLVDGLSEGQFETPDQSTTTFTADAAGVYKVRLSVSDGQFTNVDDVFVIYRFNEPPTAVVESLTESATAGRAPLELSAAASRDPNSDPLSYEWDVISSPPDAQYTLDASVRTIATLTAATPGEYTVQLSVSDGTFEDVDSLSFAFDENQPPNADPSLSEIEVGPGLWRANLNASASSDPDGDPLTFFWEILSSPEGSNPSLDRPDDETPMFFMRRNGDYHIRLTVDDRLASDSEEIVLTVGPSEPPVADASRSETRVVFGSGFSRLDATLSSDPDDRSLSYRWRFVLSSNGTTPVIENSTRDHARLVPSQPGVYVVELSVSDGASVSIDYVLVTFVGNESPVADASLSDTTVHQGMLPQLNASRSHDPDGNPLGYRWEVVASSTGVFPEIVAEDQEVAMLVTTEVGSYAVRLTVDDGMAIDTDLVLVTVLERIEPLLPGDFNDDGSVDQSDLDLVLLNWGTELADPTAIGWTNDIPTAEVGQEHLDAVLLNWGNRITEAEAEPPLQQQLTMSTARHPVALKNNERANSKQMKVRKLEALANESRLSLGPTAWQFTTDEVWKK